MAGRHYLYVEAGELVDRALHEDAEARDDVGVVAEGLGLEALVLARAELVVEHAVAEHAEAPEGVAGEEGARGGLEGHHRLGPMHVGRFHEGEDQAGAEVEGVARLDGLDALLDLVEALDELDALGRREYLDLGIEAPVVGEPARVVGLEVVEHEVVDVGELDARLRETRLEGGGGPAPVPNQVYEGDLVAFDEVGVEGDAVGYRPDAFEEIFGLDVGVQRVDSDR